MGDELTREDFFSTERLEEVEVDYLDGRVWAQPLPFAFGKQLLLSDGDLYERADEIILYGIVDGDGNRIFREEDRERIDNLPNPVAMTLCNAVLDASDIGTVVDAEEAEEVLEEAREGPSDEDGEGEGGSGN